MGTTTNQEFKEKGGSKPYLLYSSASIGSISAAFLAGYSPNITPKIIEKRKAVANATRGMSKPHVNPACAAPKDIAHDMNVPIIIPTTPPIKVIKIDSMRNCVIMSL